MTPSLLSPAPRRALLVAALAALGLAAGCAPMLVGGAVAGSAMVATDRRSAGTQVDDSTNEVKALAAIDATIGQRGHVTATSYNRLVLLTGEGTGATKRSVAGEKTDSSEHSASFRVAGGVAHNDDLQAYSPLLRLSGSGDIHLADSRINYLAKATVVATVTGQEGKELANLKGITVPVRLAGPFDALTFQPDFAAVANDLARARLGLTPQQLQQTKQGKISAQVPDKLKGEFWR